MGKIYLHSNTNVTSDQDWIIDVQTVLLSKIGWDGQGTNMLANTVTFWANSASGIKFDHDNPDYGWHDLLSPIKVDREAASNKPNFNVYRGGIKAYQFTVNDQVYSEYHIPHDYLKNSQLFIHVHWSHTSGSSPTGNVNFGIEATYANGHNQSAFSSPITTFVDGQPSPTQYQHIISEVPISGNTGLFSNSDFEVDGLMLVRIYLANNNLSPATDPFIHFVDLHYRSTGIPTKHKAPDFYS